MLLLEIFSYVNIVVVWYLMLRFGKRNIAKQIVVGAIFGFFLEFSTEPVCDYYFRLALYKDMPPVIPFAWGAMFALSAALSEKLYKTSLSLPSLLPGDKRIFLFDLIAGLLIGFPAETAGYRLGVWTYNVDALGWTLGWVPVFNMPTEALISYGLIMLIGPTYVRFWGGATEVRP